MATATVENYLKSIYQICLSNDGVASTNQISELIQNSPASVSNMLKKLAELEMIEYKKYYGVRLTDKGTDIAKNLVRKHRLWETFLVNSLGFGWSEVHDIAEQLEHVDSNELIDRLDSFLGYPKFDPHGDPIPNAQGQIDSIHQILLSDVEIGNDCQIARVIDDNEEFLRFLDSLNIKIGTKVRVIQKFNFDSSIQLLMENEQTLLITKNSADKIYVIQQ